ncbi:putative serine/threonine protein kinase [Streptomyces bingchenggensis BCW-1]|uniref:Putative serine/threonine protein kinase n=2 Tax=Streptomyces TaxID=1883 RepID=D7CH41_STRBB|nr:MULTISPECIES: bifunctional serine/threonine-protein kinase/ABC transporter substrate-binding protein [Streptomyces]ADI04876.1 putative serine/threonine protein kinase [Streptomyces bingchenggensis BCW-1]
MIPLRSGDPVRIGGYRLLGRLGAGGMGIVYLARSTGGALVALKVIQAQYAHDPQFRARFRREVTAARSINTPWATTVPDADTESDTPWLATTYIPGPTLTETITTHGPLPHTTTHTLATNLAQALHTIHQTGLIHRDIKPANILLAPNGPRLIDFGIARAHDDTAITARDVVIGSPGYLSPEQALGRGPELGPPSDIFSLGCVLAYATTGRPPFGTGPVAAMLFRTVHDTADLTGVPDGLRPLVEACLDKDPGRRPTAAELVRLLAEVGPPADGTGWLPRPVAQLIAKRSAELLALPDVPPTVVGPADEAPKPRPGRRRFLAVASGGAVLAAGGGLGIWAASLPDAGSGGGGRPTPPRWTVGVHADLTEGQAAAGTAQRRGAELAVERLNARADRPVTLALKVLDDRGAPGGARGVAERMAADPAVIAVIGPTADATCEAAIGTYDKAGLPLLSVSVGTAEVSAVEHPSYLQTRPDDGSLGLPLLSYLALHTRPHRTALVDDRAAGDYSWNLVRSMATAMRGGDLPSVTVTVPANTRDFGRAVDEVRRSGVRAVVFGGLAPRAALFARELASAGFTGARLATQPVIDAAFLKRAGAAANGWLLSSAFIDATALPAARPFAAAYRKRYASALGRYAAEAYDVVGLIAQALRELGPQGADREAMARRLRAVRYRGITKTYAFERGNGSLTPGTGLFLYRVEKGRFRFLGDYESATRA